VSTTPLVSVVVPTKNRWPLLQTAVRTVLGQSTRDLELLVVDDGSTDETPQRVAALDDPRLVVLRHERSQGVSRARNEAIERARGTWVAFLDDDDFWARDKLELQLEAAGAQGADFISTAALRVRADGRVVSVLRAPRADDLERGLLRKNVVGGPSTVLVATDAVRRVGGFDERLSVCADWELWLRLARVCRVAVRPEPLAAILQHGENMQVVDIDRALAELRYMVVRHGNRFDELGAAFGGPELSAWIAHNLRRDGQRLRAAGVFVRAGQRHRRPRLLASALASVAEELSGLQRPHRVAPPAATPAWVQRELAAVPSAD
jgi:glycosyltransferase involved in cell wall biosynthesis